MFTLEKLIREIFDLDKNKSKQNNNINETPKQESKKDIIERNVERQLSELENILCSLKIDKENVMLTGSIALYKHGLLPEDRAPHDIDVIVKGDKELDRDFQTLTKINGGNEFWKQKEYYSQLKPEHKPFMFVKREVVFNFWIIDENTEFDTELKSKEGYYIATVKHILDAKKVYGRKKDLKDILSIITNLIN